MVSFLGQREQYLLNKKESGRMTANRDAKKVDRCGCRYLEKKEVKTNACRRYAFTGCEEVS